MSARQLGLAARVALATLVGVLALAGDTLAAESAPAAARCCFRVDVLVQAELDTIFNSGQVGGMVGHQEALVTYRDVELLVLSADGTLRRAKGGPGRRVRKALVKSEIGEVLPDQTYHPHDPGARPHEEVGGMTVDVCFRYVSPGRMKAEAAKIRALAGKKPPTARSLPCR